MNHKTIRIFCVAVVLGGFIFAVSGIGFEQDERLAQMMARIKNQGELNEVQVRYFRKLTPLLFDYLRTIRSKEEMESLYQANSLLELGSLIEQRVGKNIIDFGEEMFAYFEQKAAQGSKVNIKEWSLYSSEHFLFYTHPGSRAEAEIDLIRESAEDTYISVVSALNIKNEVKNTSDVLHAGLKDKNENGSCIGKIGVYLHQIRRGETLKRLGKHSMGNMSFGATILRSGEDKGWGRLTATIHVLYFNAFSLPVLHHEIAHGLLFLGSFDPSGIKEKPLRSKSELKNAFFSGYKAISSFLHEGIGDYALYYQGFYQHWPVFSPPEELARRVLDTDRYIPLSKLIKEGVSFRSSHHKEYSLEAAVFIHYLIQNYGKDKLKQWFLAGEKHSHETFNRIYGTEIQDIEKEWHLFLKKSAAISWLKKKSEETYTNFCQ